MSTIPPEAKKAMMAVVDAMGGDDYNYYSDFTTTVASSSRAKIIANFRVVVPQVQRQRATANLQRNIGDKYVVSAENNQIDVLITGTNKKIRINVKPPVGGGYSAAKKTSIAESAQAVYCQYVVDNTGVTLDGVIDSAKLENAYDKCVTTGASFEEIESIDPDWKSSSIMGALRLKRPYSSGYKYVRGGDLVSAVKDAFDKVKKAQKMTSLDLNKWSPADIYIAKNGFTVQQLKQELDGVKTWESLNARMLKLMTSKTFIGVSLKKMKSSATLIPVNVSSVDRYNTDKISYDKMSSPMYSTSGYIYGKKGASPVEVNLRTFTSDGGFAGEITGGGSARHGKVGHGPINKILKSHGLPELPDNPTSRSIANQGTDKMAQWVAKTSVSLGLIKPNQEAEAEMQWKSPKPTAKSDNPVNYRQSKYLTVKLFEIIDGINDNDTRNMVVEDMIRYATSTIRGVSGPYMKLY